MISFLWSDDFGNIQVSCTMVSWGIHQVLASVGGRVLPCERSEDLGNFIPRKLNFFRLHVPVISFHRSEQVSASEAASSSH